MSNEMSAAEQQKLFNQMSKAISSTDEEKLNSLFADEEVKDEQEEEVADDAASSEETEEEETPDTEEESAEEPTTTEEESTEDDSPPEEADTEDNKEDKDDPLADLRKQLEQLEKENHHLKSQAGRLKQIPNRLKELDKKLEELSKQTSPSDRPSAKVTPKVQAALQKLSETEPELAEQIAAAVGTAISGFEEESITRQREELTKQRESLIEDHRAEEADRLLSMYPNAPQVFASPAWAEWKKEQIPGVRRLAESDSADDVAFAFKKYAEDMLQKYPELAKPVGTDEQPTSAANDETARKIEAERLKRKKTAAKVDSPNAQGKTGLPDDPQALFELVSKQIRKEISG